MPLSVDKIQEGTVIDRIEPGRGLRVMQAIGVGSPPTARIALVVNVPSHHMGHKDILKVEGIFLDIAAISKIALISPRARINIIRGGKVEKKQDVSLPPSIRGMAKCPNPKCISNMGAAEAAFAREDLRLRCAYCERMFDAQELI